MSHKKILFKMFVILLLIGLAEGCVTVDHQGNKPIAADYLPQYWLTTSMYAGRFYDNDQLRLLDSRPFDAINDVETVDGYILYPPKATNTVPAGTLVKIAEISYPSDLSRINRPIYSPRDQIWVYLKVAKDRGKVTLFHEKNHVLVVPKNITNETQLRGYLGRFFSLNDPNSWILTLPSHLFQGILEKRPVLGMTREHLTAALGPALKKQFQARNAQQTAQEVWHFHDYFIVLENGVVSKIKRLSKPSNEIIQQKTSGQPTRKVF